MTGKYYSRTPSWRPVKSLPSKAKLILKVGYKNWFRTSCSGGYCPVPKLLVTSVGKC